MNADQRLAKRELRHPRTPRVGSKDSKQLGLLPEVPQLDITRRMSKNDRIRILIVGMGALGGTIATRDPLKLDGGLAASHEFEP
jgi:hypothetical protein